jgi:hypothetical protein
MASSTSYLHVPPLPSLSMFPFPYTHVPPIPYFLFPPSNG